MKIEIVKTGFRYEVAVLPKLDEMFKVFELSKTEIRQLIKRLEGAIK